MSGRLFDPTGDQSFQPRSIVPQADVGGAGAVGAAMANFGATLGQEAQRLQTRMADAERAGAETAARTTLTLGLADLRRSLAEGDPATIRQRWEEGTTALRARVREQAPEAQRSRVDRLAQQMAAADLGSVLDLQARRTGDVARADLLTGVDALVQAAAAEADPARRADYLATIEAAVSGNVAGGVIGAEAGARMLAGARRRLDYEVARGMVRAQRGAGPGVVERLPLPPLPPEDIAALRDEAMDDMIAAGHESQAEEQQAQAAHAAVVDETFSAALGGAAPVERVMALRYDMDPARFEAALTLASGRAATQDDPDEVDDLAVGVGAGAVSLFRGRLDRALAARRITPETHRRLTDLDLSMRGDDPVSRARRQDREAVAGALDVRGLEGVPGVALGTFTRIRTSALDAWEAWQAANPQASPQERREARAFAIDTARQDMVEAAVAVLPRLPGVTIEGGRPPRLADLDRIERDLIEALDADAMDAGDAAVAAGIADDLELLDRWRVVAGMAEAQGGNRR